MVRLLLILALICLIRENQAISFEENEKQCEELQKYSGTDNAFGVAVSRRLPQIAILYGQLT
jgi:hypothetical protein